MLIPNHVQNTKMFQYAGAARFAYNWALAREKENYEKVQLISNELIANGDPVYKLSKSEDWSIVIPVEKEKETCEFEYGSHMELEQEANVLTKLLAEQSMDIIFVDSYNVSNVYFGKLHKYTKCLVYLDDIAAFSYDVDVVLNYNFSAFQMGYEEILKEQKLLLGVKYCPLREEFLNMPKRAINEKVADIFITTGAADPKNVTSGLISLALEQLPQCRLHVVVGKAFVYKDELYELQAKNNNILLYEN